MRATLSLAGLAVLVVSASAAKPHLVYILIDDLGFNDNWDRSPDIKWPHVSKLALQGIALETFYTQPICTPSRGSLLSGRWPVRLGLQNGVITGGNNYGLPLNETSLASKLKAAGYGTYGVGKWHQGYYNNESAPSNRGFDEFYGYWQGASDYFTHCIGATPQLDLHSNLALQTGSLDEKNHYSTYLFESRVESLVTAHKAKFPTKPMFLYYPMQNVHSPLEAPPTTNPVILSTCGKITNTDRQTFCKMAMIADVAIGNLTALLDSTFAGEDLLMVVSGDNGGMPGAAGNNFPLRGTKAELFEGGIRNNCFLRSKTLIPKNMVGQRYNGGLVHLVDWHATFAKLGGAAPNPAGFELDGMDMFTTITTNATSPRTEFLININPVANCQPPDGTNDGLQLRHHTQACAPEMAYRFGRWKYVANTGNDTHYPIPATPDGYWGKATHHEAFTGKMIPPWKRGSRRLRAAPAPPSAACLAEFNKDCPSQLHQGATCHACFLANEEDLSAAGCFPLGPAFIQELCMPGPGPDPEALFTALFDIEADPNEDHNVLAEQPPRPDTSKIVATILGKLKALEAVAMPPGNTSADGRAQQVAIRDGGLNCWCPLKTPERCVASATPGAPDVNSE